MKRVMAFALMLTLLTWAAQAQQRTSAAKTTKRRAAAATNDADIAAQLSQLRQGLEAQQEQMKQLS